MIHQEKNIHSILKVYEKKYKYILTKGEAMFKNIKKMKINFPEKLCHPHHLTLTRPSNKQICRRYTFK